MQQHSETQIKGLFLSRVVQIAKENHDQQALDAIFKHFGTQDIPAFTNYDYNDEMFVYKSVYHDLFENKVKNPYFEVGKRNFEIFMSIPLGKTAMQVFRKNFTLIAHQTQKMMSVIIDGMKTDFREEINGDIIIFLFNSPYPVELFGGIFQAALEHLHADYSLSFEKKSGGTSQYYFEKQL